MHKRGYLVYIWHTLLWLIYTISPVYYAYQRLAIDPEFIKFSTFHNPFFWMYVTFSSIFLFYFNAHYLIPEFYKKKRTVYYYLIAGLLTVFFVLVRGLLRYYVVQEGSDELTWYFYFNSLIPYLFIFGISTAYHFFLQYQNEQQVKSELENEQLRSELSFLRSQISPHFMFNIMNSMVSLARKKSDLLEPMLLKMSDILRYMLYEKEGSKITLEKEMNYLANYIDLQKLRFGKKFNIDFSVNLQDVSLTIEPMLLIPFVENAFKHGTGVSHNRKIIITIEQDHNTLKMMVQNDVSSEANESKDSSSGIGLANVKRRLELLYPNDYELQINQDLTTYTVHLTIKLA